MLNDNNVSVNYNADNTAILTINEGDDAGISFKFGKVWVDDADPENPSLQFQYDLVSGTPLDKSAFEHSIATYLHSTILDQLEAGSLHYSGGTDEVAESSPSIESLIQEASTGIDIGDSLVQNIGEFRAKPQESAMSFLDRLSAQGTSQMNKK